VFCHRKVPHNANRERGDSTRIMRDLYGYRVRHPNQVPATETANLSRRAEPPVRSNIPRYPAITTSSLTVLGNAILRARVHDTNRHTGPSEQWVRASGAASREGDCANLCMFYGPVTTNSCYFGQVGIHPVKRPYLRKAKWPYSAEKKPSRNTGITGKNCYRRWCDYRRKLLCLCQVREACNQRVLEAINTKRFVVSQIETNIAILRNQYVSHSKRWKSFESRL